MEREDDDSEGSVDMIVEEPVEVEVFDRDVQIRRHSSLIIFFSFRSDMSR